MPCDPSCVLTVFFSPVFNLSYIFSVRPVVLNRSRSTNLLLSKYFILSNLSINIVNCNFFLIIVQSGMKSESELPVTMGSQCKGTVYALFSITLSGRYCCNILVSHAPFRFNPGTEVPVTLKSETELPVTMVSQCYDTFFALVSLTLLGEYCCNILLSHALFRFIPGTEVPVTLKFETELPVTMESRCSDTFFALDSLTLLGEYCCVILLSHALFRFNTGTKVPVTPKSQLFIFAPGTNNRHSESISRRRNDINFLQSTFLVSNVHINHYMNNSQDITIE